MADADIQGMLVRIEATTAGLRRELDLGDSRVKKFADNTNRAGSSVDGAFSGMASAAARLLGPLVSAVSAFEALSKAVEVQRQFDVLNAGLITATGSSEKAAVAFQALQRFAAQTPYSLDQAVEGFTKLVNLGLTPSEAALNSYGNTAAAMGKDLNQMIEAVADAATGEFERLKEFGITSSQQGDKVSLTFRGVTTTIGKNATEIEGYLLNLGNTDFAGAMDQRAKTLDGAISNLGDTWDTTFRLINERGLGELMKDAVDIAATALQDLNDSLASGQFEAHLEAIGSKFDGVVGDIGELLVILDGLFSEFFGQLGSDMGVATAAMIEAFSDFPENVRAFIQLMTVEVLAGFDKAQAYAVAFKDGVKAVFTNDTLDQVGARLAGSLNVINQAREGSIEQIITERDAAVGAYKQQSAAADERLKKYREERATALATGGDVLAQFGKQAAATNTNTAASKELEAQKKREAKALADLKAQADIAIRSTGGLADAYLAGIDKSREFTLQQKVEQELLKTGAAARAEVEKAIHGQADAEDRLAISKQAYDLGKDAADQLALAKATLQGADALQAYNVQKAMQTALAGKNIEAGSKEYQLLLDATTAQQAAIKIAQQAGSAGSIMDRLYPESKLLKDYTEDQKALNAAMELYPEHSYEYQAALVKLGKEYEVNQSKATLWGQMTEGAVDRIDGVFADAWANIGSGADGLWDNLVKGAKQAFGEIAHMLTTKPLLASISNWLTGTDNGQGLGSVWGRLLGDSSGGGSGGGSLTGSIASLGKTVYQLYSAVTGVGQSVATGYASGGFSGAVSGGVNYYGNMLSGISDTLSTGFGNLAGAIFGSGASQIAANAATSAALNAGLSQSVTQIGTQFAANVGFEAAGQQLAAGFAQQVAGSAATTGVSAGLMGQLAAMASNPVGWAIAAVTSAYQSGKLYDQGMRWDTKEVMNTDLVKYSGGVGQVMIGQLGLTNDILEKVVGGKLAAIFSGSVFASAMITGISNKIFGGSWVTKDQGIQLGVTAGDLDAYKYTYQKKKGGLFGSNKSRTKLGPLDEEMQTELQSAFDARIDTVFSIFDSLNVDVPEAALDGLNMDAWKISLKDLTSEQVNQMISDFFEVLGNEAVGAISKSMNLGLDTYNVNQLTEFVSNLYGINDTFKLLNVNALPVSVWGGKLAEQYVALAGGLENFSTATQTYYGAFFSDAEKSADTLEAVRKQFADLNITFPGSKEGFRAMVEGIDSTTDAGRTLFLQLMGLAGNASAAYDILAQQQKALVDGAGTSFSTLQRSIQAQQKALTEAYNAQVSSLNDMMTTATTKVSDLTGVSNDLESALKQLSGTSDESVKLLRKQAQATLQSALATARAGGSLANFSGLSDALDAIGSNSTDLYASLEDFNRDQGETANVVAELNQLNGRQLTSAQQTVKTLQDQLDQAKKAYDAQTAVFDAQLSFAQSQLDALNGVDNSVKSVADAVKAMNAAVVAALAGLSGGKSLTPDNSGVFVDTAYQSVYGAGYQADAPGRAYWQQQLASGAISLDQLEQAIRNAAKANGTLPAFASGGLISGPGTGTSDSILARVSNGEYMMNAAAVSAYGTDLLDQMNSLSLPAFAAGGPVVSIPKLGQASSSSGTGGNDAVGEKLDRLAGLLERLVGPVGDIRDNSNKGKQMLDKWDRVGLPADAEV